MSNTKTHTGENEVLAFPSAKVDYRLQPDYQLYAVRDGRVVAISAASVVYLPDG